MEHFYVRVLTMKDAIEVRKYVHLYLEEEVSVQCLNFTQVDKNIFVETAVEDVLNQELSVGVFENSTGDMCGCLLVYDWKSTVVYETYAKHGTISESFEKLIRFDGAMEEGIKDIAAGRTYWLLGTLIVDLRHLQKGLGSRLVSSVEDLARQNNVDLLFGEANSNFSLKICINHGFVPVKKILYADYKDPVTGELLFRSIPSPHTASVLMVQDLCRLSNL